MTDEEKRKLKSQIQIWKEVDQITEKLDETEMAESFEILTSLNGMWAATPWDYSSSRWVRFYTNHTAELCYGYGQTIYALIKAEFEIPQPKIIRIKFLDSPAVAFFKGFTPQNNQLKEAFFLITEKDESFTKSITGKEVSYKMNLRLSNSLFPDEIQFPYELPSEFYGFRVCE